MKNKGIASCLIVMALWGALYPMVKLGYRAFGIGTTGEILTFAGVRFLICGGVVTIFSFIRNKSEFDAVKANLLSVLAAGFFAIILHYGLSYLGLHLTAGSKSAILKQMGAVFYICFSALFFKDDKLTLKKLAGMVLGLLGILVINLDSTGFHFYLGDLFILLSSFCTVFSNIIFKIVFERVEPIVAAGVSQFFGGTVLMCIGLSLGGSVTKLIPHSGEQSLVVGFILIASIISYCLWYLVVKKQKLSQLYIIKFSEPLFAAAVSAVVLGEDIFNLKYLAAFVLISMGIFIVNRKK